jgi:hypothetical protein
MSPISLVIVKTHKVRIDLSRPTAIPSGTRHPRGHPTPVSSTARRRWWLALGTEVDEKGTEALFELLIEVVELTGADMEVANDSEHSALPSAAASAIWINDRTPQTERKIPSASTRGCSLTFTTKQSAQRRPPSHTNVLKGAALPRRTLLAARISALIHPSQLGIPDFSLQVHGIRVVRLALEGHSRCKVRKPDHAARIYS